MFDPVRIQNVTLQENKKATMKLDYLKKDLQARARYEETTVSHSSALTPEPSEPEDKQSSFIP